MSIMTADRSTAWKALTLVDHSEMVARNKCMINISSVSPFIDHDEIGATHRRHAGIRRQ
jgi:hypothetical protein